MFHDDNKNMWKLVQFVLFIPVWKPMVIIVFFDEVSVHQIYTG